MFGVNQGNSIRYEGTTPSKTLGRDQGVGISLGANLMFGRLRVGANAKVAYEHESFGTQSVSQWTPGYFLYATYGFNQRSSLTLSSELSRHTVPMKERNPDFVMQSLVSAVQGNPELKPTRYNSANLFYTYIISNHVALSLYSQWNRFNNDISVYYSPEMVDGAPVMVQRMANKGFESHLKYGGRVSANFFNRALTIEVGVSGNNDRAHSFTNKSLDYVRVTANASYYWKRWFAQAFWGNPTKTLSNFGIYRTPSYYMLTLGYGYNNLVVQVTAANIFNSSWKLYEGHFWTSNYDQHFVNEGGSYHRSFKINLSYSFGYGKRIERGNELEGGVSISSGLVN